MADKQEVPYIDQNNRNVIMRKEHVWEIEDEPADEDNSWQMELYTKLGKYRNEDTEKKAVRYVQDCIQQNASFATAADTVEAHIEKSVDFRFVCRHCGASTTDKSSFMVHLSQRHRLLPRRFLCLRCHLASNYTERLLRHIVRQHIKPVVCEQCNELLFEKSQLSNHKIMHLELCRVNPLFLAPDSHTLVQIGKNINGKLTCSLCGTFEVSLVESLKLHLSEAHDALPKRYMCLHCSFTDNFSSAFKSHYEKNHPELKISGRSPTENVCPKCGKSFSSGAALNAHLRHQHAAVGFSCEICSQAFRTYFQMYRHKLKHRNENKYTSDQNSIQPTKCCIYRCTFGTCDRTFKRASRLRDHLNTHYGTSSYKCHICTKTFTRKDTLDVHLKTVHEGLRPFSCSLCEYRASQGSLLRSHIKAIHKNASVISDFMNGEISQPLLKKKREYIIQYNQQQTASQQQQPQQLDENAIGSQSASWNWSHNNNPEWTDFVDALVTNQNAPQSVLELNNGLNVYDTSYVTPAISQDVYCNFTDAQPNYFGLEADVETKNLPVKERLKIMLKDNNICQNFTKSSTDELNKYCEFDKVINEGQNIYTENICQCLLPNADTMNQFQGNYDCAWANELCKTGSELKSDHCNSETNEFFNGLFANPDSSFEYLCNTNNECLFNDYNNYEIPDDMHSLKYSFNCNQPVNVTDTLSNNDSTTFDWPL